MRRVQGRKSALKEIWNMSRLNKTYLGFTFLFMAIGWGICLLCSFNGISLNDSKWLYAPFLLGGWSPTIASYLSLRGDNQVAGMKEWLKNIFDLKHNVLSYLMVAVMAIIFILPQCLISGYENGAPVFAIIVMIPMMLVGGGLEEAGWRYILQPELEKKYPFTVSTILVSVIWWLWHLPLFYIQGAGQFGQYFAFGINVLGLSFALASIRKNTGSVWLCVLFHCIVNSFSGIFIIHDNIWGNIAATMILILCSYALVAVNGRLKVFKR